MTHLISLLFSGGVSGSIYALLAVGVVLSYSTSRVFNFGHAAVAFSAAFVYYQLNSGLGWNRYVSLVVVVCVFAPLAGIAWDRLVFRRVTDSSEAVRVVVAVGVLLVMPALVEWVANILRKSAGLHLLDIQNGYQTPGIGPKVPAQWHLMEGVVITSDQVIALGAGFVLFVAVWSVLRFTRYGLIVRSAVDRPTLARLRGTETGRVSATVWIASFMLAGVAGVVAGPINGFGVVSNNYTVALFVAATAVVLARLRSIPLAFLGGLLLGAATNLAEGYLNGSYLGAVGRWIQNVHGLQASLPYWALLIGLLVLGKDRRRAAGTAAETALPLDYTADLSLWRRRAPWVVGTIVLVAYAFGPIGIIWRQALELGLAMTIVYLSYTIVTGLGGMISLAQPALVTASGLFTGYFAIHDGWPIVPAAIAAILICGGLGTVLALPALRLGGIPLALATLALGLLGDTVLFQDSSLDNASQGWTLSRPKLGILNLTHDRVMVGVLLVIVAAAFFVTRNLTASASGRAILAIRSSEPAAAANGVSMVATKITLFGVSAMMAGLGGVMLAISSGTVTSTTYPTNPTAFLWLAIIVVWGVRRPGAAIISGLVTVFFPQILSTGIHIGHVGWGGTTETLIPQILFGLGAVGLAKSPGGALEQMGERRQRRRLARKASTATAAASVMTVMTPDGLASVAEDRMRVAREPEQTESLLALDGIRAGYGLAEVLHNLSLQIPTAGVTSIVGPNGAGKSTLCQVLAGVVPPTSGTVTFAGKALGDATPAQRFNAGLMLVPESRGIFPGLSVDENLSLLLPKHHDRERVYERFPVLGTRRRVLAENLSGGEQQMLSIGPILIRPPRLLIVDEPTLGLAEIVADLVLESLAEIARNGTSVVVVEEKARSGLGIADTVVVLYNGAVRLAVPIDALDMDHLELLYVGGSLDGPPGGQFSNGGIGERLDAPNPSAGSISGT